MPRLDEVAQVAVFLAFGRAGAVIAAIVSLTCGAFLG